MHRSSEDPDKLVLLAFDYVRAPACAGPTHMVDDLHECMRCFPAPQAKRENLILKAARRRGHPGQRQMIDRERAVLTHLQAHPHAFINGLRRTLCDDHSLYLAMPFVGTGGSMLDVLRSGGAMPEEHARFYSAEVAIAIDHLHAHDVIHHDVLPEHVLIGMNGHCVLIGLRAAKVRASVSPRSTHEHTTRMLSIAAPPRARAYYLR